MRCGYRGLLFNAVGRCIEIPAQASIPERACVRSYPAEERDSWIWVWTGTPESADRSKIPDVVGLDHPAWQMQASYLHYKASYQLLHDNLLDFSHLSFVHFNTFGGSDARALAKPQVTKLDNGFRIARWFENAAPAPFLKALGDFPPVDIKNEYDFVIPGVLVIRTSQQAHGMGTREAMSEIGAFDNITSQAVTPEIETTSHYFFSSGARRGTPPRVLEVAMASFQAAFEEDRDMIEAQQRVISARPGLPIGDVAINADGPLWQMRELIRRHIEEESKTQ